MSDDHSAPFAYDDLVDAVQRGDDRAKEQLFAALYEELHAIAQSSLGLLYDEGRGVPKDASQAVMWMRKAADQGNAIAQFNLAVQYSTGNGGTQDYGEAATWFRKAAEQGEATAQFNLGFQYSTGKGVAEDPTEAAKWFQKAADQGVAHAQANLGSLYSHGRGVPQGYVQAYMWFDLAAPGFPDAVAYRDFAAGKLTREQVVRAQQLVQDWRAIHAPRAER